MFTAFVRCGALLEPEWRTFVVVTSVTEATVKCFLKAKLSRIYSMHGSWYTFQVVVDDDELEITQCGLDDFKS